MTEAGPQRYFEKAPLFPYVDSWVKRADVTIALGGNEGKVAFRFSHLMRKMLMHPAIRVARTSPLYHNPPQGYVKQNSFVNAVVSLRTTLGIRTFFALTKYWERRFGRKKTFRNGPRTLDVDILFFHKLKVRWPHLVLPHPRWRERDFVVVPLAMLHHNTRQRMFS